MDIRQVQYFLSVVETGSFSAAAEEHYISQSSLSKMIIALEKELAVVLFDRSKRKISLTEAGKAFLAQAQKISDVHKTMLMEMDVYRSAADTFSIAAIPVLTQYGIANAISLFRDQHPDIRFNLEEIDGLNIASALAEHRFDLAFMRHNFLDPEQFTSIEMCKDKLLVVVSKKNHHADRASISIKELSNDNFILFDKVTDLYKLVMDECTRAGFDPTVFYSSHRKISVFGLVATNIGLALMPSRVYEYHQQPDVIGIPLEEYIECNLVLARGKNRKLPGNVDIFIDFMKRYSSAAGI